MIEKSLAVCQARITVLKVDQIIVHVREFHKFNGKHYEVDLLQQIKSFRFIHQQSLLMTTFIKDFLFIQAQTVHYLDYIESFWIIYEKEKAIISFSSSLFGSLTFIFQLKAFIRTLKRTSLATFGLNIP